MNRLALTTALLAALVIPGTALADDEFDAPSIPGVTNIHAKKKFGLGLGGGAYGGGATGKLFLGNTIAVQAFLNTGWFGFNLGADALYQGKQLWTNGDLALNWEAGAGAFVSTWGGIGVNAVVGLSLQYKPVPLEFTTDFRPTFLVGNWSGYRYGAFGPIDYNYGGAVRYYF